MLPSALCSLSFSDPEGYIDSSDYPPLPFNSFLECTYNVTVYTGYGVELQVTGPGSCRRLLPQDFPGGWSPPGLLLSPEQLGSLSLQPGLFELGFVNPPAPGESIQPTSTQEPPARTAMGAPQTTGPLHRLFPPAWFRPVPLVFRELRGQTAPGSSWEGPVKQGSAFLSVCPYRPQVKSVNLSEGELLSIRGVDGSTLTVLANQTLLVEGQVIRSPTNTISVYFRTFQDGGLGTFQLHYQGTPGQATRQGARLRVPLAH
ncbi:Hypothetical predicted protein [Marmota monax]|uniref:CUB domain-containing protein n=1 Tax=Marmota monax TaxID=9995 RepID=A0A5E4B7B7_MARMO|nr:Hypothetical predicted protein [Marmota monax]